MFASALLQYSSSDRAFSSNLRFRWEYRPGSELFVVYTDERDITEPRAARRRWCSASRTARSSSRSTG